MIKSLRKRHLQIWSMLMVLLPAAIISARLATPKAATDQLLQPATIAAYPFIVKTVQNKNYTVHIRKDKDSSLQLEWINKQILTVPTCTIYSVPEGSGDTRNGQLIGRIEAMGTYHFVLPAGAASIRELLLYDFIHGQVIDRIHF
jgi:hypothetical protein